MSDIFSRLSSKEPLLSDGGMGSMLIAEGLKPGECPERLCLENRDVLARIAQAYYDTGADILHTNSFGGSPIKLKQYDLHHRARDINARAVEIVRKVVKHDRYVSASIGPSGGMLEPYGELSEEELFESFGIQIEAVRDAGADMLTIETMTDLNEALIAVRAAREVAASLPLLTTMTFDKTPKGFFTMMGDSVEKATAQLKEFGVNVVGSNCGNGIVNMVAIAKEFLNATDLPVMIQSNAGLPELIGGELIYPESPQFMAQRVEEMLDLGVTIVGGCCGTTPAHIKAFRKVIDRRH